MGESEPRALIWVQAAIYDVRAKLHKAGMGPALLIPVESGTVVVPNGRISTSVVTSWAHRIKPGSGALVLMWDDEAAIAFPVAAVVVRGWAWGPEEAVNQLTARAGRHSGLGKALLKFASAATKSSRTKRAKQDQAAQRIAGVVGAEQVVLTRVREWERGGADVIAQLMDDVGRPEIAQLVRLVHRGAFDARRTVRPPARLPFARIFMITLVLGLPIRLLADFITLPTILWSLITLVVLLLLLGVILGPRIRIRRRPIDEVLPIVPVVNGQPASDSQSAK